jgi:thiol:disulfide interchange protein
MTVVRGAVLAVAGWALVACGADEPAVPAAPRIAWTSDVRGGLARAKAEGRPVLLAFVSSESPRCRELEAGPFDDPRVIEAAARFVAVRVDVRADRDAARAFRAAVLPDVRFLGAGGWERGRLRNRAAGEAWDAASVAEQLRIAASGVPPAHPGP